MAVVVGNPHLVSKESGPVMYAIDEAGGLEDPPLITIHVNMGQF